MQWEEVYEKFCENFGCSKKMVLSTSWEDKVTSRMMSIIRIRDCFYFQTDKNFRKYQQIQHNPNVSLCIDTIQIEGICKEAGSPSDNSEFCELYKTYFKSSYERYSGLSDERLFIITPVYMQKWIYENQEPFVEVYDLKKKMYEKIPYIGR